MGPKKTNYSRLKAKTDRSNPMTGPVAEQGGQTHPVEPNGGPVFSPREAICMTYCSPMHKTLQINSALLSLLELDSLAFASQLLTCMQAPHEVVFLKARRPTCNSPTKGPLQALAYPHAKRRHATTPRPSTSYNPNIFKSPLVALW